MLPPISNFLNDTLVENLKKPLQPAGLFSSAIFLFLNLILFLFTPGGQKLAIVMAFLDLGTTWQIVLSSVMVLVLAYVILSLRSTIYRLMTGESWADSPVLGLIFKSMQKRARNRLKQEIKLLEREKTDIYALKAWELSIRFPEEPEKEEEEKILPTALGNALKVIALRMWERHGLDLATVWPYMEIVIVKDAKLETRIENEKSSLDFLVYLALVLTVFSFEHAIVRLWLVWRGLSPVAWPAMSWSLVLLVLAYVAYRAAVNKALSWGQAMQTAFNLYQEDLRKALGLREFKSTEHRQQVWRQVAYWLARGELADPKIFTIEPEPRIVPSLISSDNVEVQLEHSTTAEFTTLPADRIRETAWINYALIVSHAGAQKAGDDQSRPAVGARILVSDRRIPRIDYKSIQIPGQDCTGQTRPEIVPTGRTDSAHDLLWRIRELKPNEACVLRYRLLRSTLYEAKTSDPKIVIAARTLTDQGDENYDMTFSIQNKADDPVGQVTLDMFDTRISRKKHTLSGKLSNQPGTLYPEQSSSGQDWYLWYLDTLPTGDSSLEINVRLKQG